MLASLLRIILLTATLKILERGLDKGPIIYNLFTENRHTFRIKYPMLRADTVIAMPTGHRFTSFLMPIPMS